MDLKRHLLKFSRGWLPQEPILRTHALPNQSKASRARIIFQNLVMGFLVIAGLFCSVLLLNSWLKFVFITLILVGGLLWRFSHGNVRKVFKFFMVAVLIFVISFTAVEFNLISNAGYPPTYSTSQTSTTISKNNMLNFSLSQMLQDIESTPTYKLLTLQFGPTEAENIKLDSSFPGGQVQVDFYGQKSNTYFYFLSSQGYPYHVNVGTYSVNQFHPQGLAAKDSFAQIDALGLQWFYDRALEIAQNRTSNLPTIDSLTITLTYGGNTDYDGLFVQFIGSHQTVLPNGYINGEAVLIAVFKPNGTLLYMSQPTQQ